MATLVIDRWILLLTLLAPCFVGAQPPQTEATEATAEGAPHCQEEVFSLGVPTLGVCYGMQLMAKVLGSDVRPARHREYGHAVIKCRNASALFKGVGDELKVWASHGDRIETLPDGFHLTASSDSAPVAANYSHPFPESQDLEAQEFVLSTYGVSVIGCRQP